MRNPPAITEADILAVLAWRAGTATADQQQRSYRWVLNEAARALGVADHDCTDREAALHEGRRTVAVLLTQMADPNLLKSVKAAAKSQTATPRGKPK